MCRCRRVSHLYSILKNFGYIKANTYSRILRWPRSCMSNYSKLCINLYIIWFDKENYSAAMEFGYRLKHLFDMPPYYRIWPILLKRTRLPYFPKKCEVATRQWFHDGLIISFRYPPNCHFLFVTLSEHEMRIDGRRFRVLRKTNQYCSTFTTSVHLWGQHVIRQITLSGTMQILLRLI